MKELIILLSPVLWTIRNNLIKFNRSFYSKILFYALAGTGFIVLMSYSLNMGMAKLQSQSSEVFSILLIKGYSLIFLIIFFIQIINGFVISFNKYYQSRELELLFISPVSRISLFFARLLETHLKTSWMLVVFGIPLLVSLGNQLHANPVYYLCALLPLIAFSIIPVNIGIGITMVMAGIFDLKKLKKILFFMGVVSVVGSISLLRLFRPERFANPELFANIRIFLSEIGTPSFILMPNRWFVESLVNFLNGKYQDTLLFVSLLILTSYITTFFLLRIYMRYHYRGWSRLHGGEVSVRKGKKDLFSGPFQRLLQVFDRQSVALYGKDILGQFHDVKVIQQNLILLVLIVLYLFSIASLPLNWEQYGLHLRYIISFFNIGLILIIIASLCSKLVYPAILSERSALWIIKTSPITARKYIWVKFSFMFIAMLTLGQLLTVFSSFFIHVEGPVFILNVLTTTLVCFSLVSMAITFSVTDLKNSMKGDEREEIKTGNTAYMVLSVFFVFFVLALEVVPIYLYFLKESVRVEFTEKAWIIISAVLLVLLFLNILVTAVSMHLSIRRFDNMQVN